MAGRLLYGDPVSRIRLDLAPTAPRRSAGRAERDQENRTAHPRSVLSAERYCETASCREVELLELIPTGGINRMSPIRRRSSVTLKGFASSGILNTSATSRTSACPDISSTFRPG